MIRYELKESKGKYRVDAKVESNGDDFGEVDNGWKPLDAIDREHAIEQMIKLAISHHPPTKVHGFEIDEIIAKQSLRHLLLSQQVPA